MLFSMKASVLLRLHMLFVLQMERQSGAVSPN